MKNIIGYALVAAGFLVAVATRVEIINSKLFFLPKDFLNNYGLYVAIGLVLLGALVFFLFKNNSYVSHTETEVPIYHGKRVVGYRRG